MFHTTPVDGWIPIATKSRLRITLDPGGLGAAFHSTTTALVANPTVVSVGEPVTLTATVTPSNALGTVTFLEGATSLGTAPLNNGGLHSP
jgi:hypothetical protein